MTQDSANDRNEDFTYQELNPLTADMLRKHVKGEIKRLHEDIFGSLRTLETDSLLIYLIASSFRLIVNAYERSPADTSELSSTIWPTNYTIARDYISSGQLSLEHLAVSVETLLASDDSANRIFESLLIFVEVIPEMEERFHNDEWALWQFRRELRTWKRQGKLQRLQISIPSEETKPTLFSRGDLQMEVSASKPTIVAGEEFSIFVVINNPFEVPIVLHSIETQVPVDLVDIVGRQRQKLALVAQDPSLRRTKENMKDRVLHATWDQWQLNIRMKTEPENRIAQAVSASELEDRHKPLDIKVDVTVENLQDGQVTGLQIGSYQSVDLEIESVSPQYLDRVLWRIDSFKRGLIPVALQPGDAIVKQFIFSTRSWLFFTPIAHKLQIQVRYSVDDRDHLDTIPFNLTIQANITATMAGAVIGGLAGGIARALSDSQEQLVATNAGAILVSTILAMILSAIVVIAFARKSGVQQIVSIEDFWGGLLIGFLVGFLGQTYAINILTSGANGG